MSRPDPHPHDPDADQQTPGGSTPGPQRFPAVIAAAPGALALLFLSVGPGDARGVPALVITAASAGVAVVCFSIIARFERERVIRQIGGFAVAVTVVLAAYRLLFLFG